MIHTKGGRKSRPPFFIAFSEVVVEAERMGSTADVAGPRPREVGGACRIQVLAAARTQETVEGPNGAKRSEFRRCCMPVGVCKSGIFAPVVLQIDHHGGESWVFAPVVLQIDHHGGESWVFAPVVGFTCADSALLPPRRVHLRPVCARNPFTQHVIFSKSTCLHNRKTPESPLQRSGAFMSKDKLQKPRLPAGGFADFEAGFQIDVVTRGNSS